jgi:choline dehydrogenase
MVNARDPVTFLNQLRWDRILLNTALGADRHRDDGDPGQFSCNVVIRTAEHLERPDLQIMVNPIRFDAMPWFPGIRAVQEHVFWAGLVQLHPESRGWVELKSADPREVAAVTLNIMAEEADREQMRRADRTARRIYNTAPMGDLLASERRRARQVQSDDELDAYIRANPATSRSTRSSTCAMGMGARSVVDPELR